MSQEKHDVQPPSQTNKVDSEEYEPPIGSNGNEGNQLLPNIANSATTLEYASLL